MYTKILNYILIIILLTIISLIIIEEIKYKRFDRYDWSVITGFKNDIGPIHIIEGNLSNKNISIILSKNDNNSFSTGLESAHKEFPADSIHLKWFSYHDNKFYQLTRKISNSRILEFLKRNNLSNYYLKINFNKDAKVDLYIKKKAFNEEDSLLIETYKGDEFESNWLLGEDRASDVFMINSKTIMYPEINIKSQSKFKKLELHYEDNKIRSIDFINNKLDFDGFKLNKGQVYRFCFTVKSKNLKEDELLNIDVDYLNIDMAKILNQLSKERVDFSIQFNALDSIENIFIKDSLKKIQLKKFKVNYITLKDYDMNEN